mmetsp:Transcript_4923/g.14244  ORF Transcript_4923/g.14244 Transcript_4923/m.14244 type:complete len:252 (-) Transcript_4923:4360-5115(-)
MDPRRLHPGGFPGLWREFSARMGHGDAALDQQARGRLRRPGPVPVSPFWGPADVCRGHVPPAPEGRVQGSGCDRPAANRDRFHCAGARLGSGTRRAALSHRGSPHLVGPGSPETRLQRSRRGGSKPPATCYRPREPWSATKSGHGRLPDLLSRRRKARHRGGRLPIDTGLSCLFAQGEQSGAQKTGYCCQGQRKSKSKCKCKYKRKQSEIGKGGDEPIVGFEAAAARNAIPITEAPSVQEPGISGDSRRRG